jgi:CBS domain containing-hemolysin-like protein
MYSSLPVSVLFLLLLVLILLNGVLAMSEIAIASLRTARLGQG